MPCPKNLEVSKNHIKLPKFLWENTLFRQFVWSWHFVSRRCDYFQFFAIMISLIWNVSILSNTHPSEGNTCRWCLVASCPHTEDSWVGEMGWGCALCAFVVCLPCACCHASAQVFRESCIIPTARFLACGWGALGLNGPKICWDYLVFYPRESKVSQR